MKLHQTGLAAWAPLLLLATFLSGCGEPYGAWENSFDPDSPSFAGLRLVEGPSELQFVTPVEGGAMVFPGPMSCDELVGATEYDFQVSDTADFGVVLLDLTSTTNVVEAPAHPSLVYGSTYYARLRGKTAEVTGTWLTPVSFVFSYGPVKFLTPDQGANSFFDGTDVHTVTWSDAGGGSDTEYHVQLCSKSDFLAPFEDTVTSATSFTTSTTTVGGWFWRVQARSKSLPADRVGAWSETLAVANGYAADFEAWIPSWISGNFRAANGHLYADSVFDKVNTFKASFELQQAATVHLAFDYTIVNSWSAAFSIQIAQGENVVSTDTNFTADSVVHSYSADFTLEPGSYSADFLFNLPTGSSGSSVWIDNLTVTR